MTSPALVQPRYVGRFACIGGACEYTCCSGWTIQVDKAHYQATRDAMLRTPGGRSQFDAAVTRQPHEVASDTNYASIALRPNGDCTFLDADRLCSLQRAHGAQILCNTCAIYPRSHAQFGATLEVGATPSCPEIARLLLLAPDAMALEAGDPARAGRTQVLQLAIRDDPDPYVAALDTVREVMLGLLGLDIPVANRLFLTLYLGDRTRAAFHRQAPPHALDAVTTELDGWSAPGRLEALVRLYDQVAEASAGATVGPQLLLELVAQFLSRLGKSPLQRWMSEVLAGGTDASSTPPPVDVGALFARHRQRAATLPPEAVAILELAFANYAQNYWFREWYLKSPDLFVHGRRLIVRVALLRLLLLGHPDFPAAVADPAALRALLVRLFYTFSRSIEHNDALLTAIETELDARGVQSLAHLVFLIRL
jgi:lysine-N-methylase